MDPPARGKEEGEDVAREAMREPRSEKKMQRAGEMEMDGPL